ncbi:MAG TPA: ABC transporter ATP-binding protein [Actinomycetales bacterium]|nr:ABC transporter ATP-binding protein [Actinomycetales bacterium]
MSTDSAGRGLEVNGAVQRGSFSLDVSVTVAAGEVLGVLGPNGAGKTTLLRALAGLDPLTTGSIRLGDLTLDDVDAATFVPPEHRPVGLVFQSYRLFPHLDVRDNVAFAPRSRGAGRRGSRALADTWLERLDLTELADRRPHEISGGQAQRVALARALAAEPDVLLLDEPLSALDAKTRLDVRAQLRAHLTQFAGPVLVITHDPLEAMVMADRLLVLEQGRIVQHGTPAQVARRPATQYVARLVGLNLYPATLDDRSGQATLDGGGSLAVTVQEDALPADEPAGTSHRVLVGLRPSAITVHTAPPGRASSRNVWPGTVVSLEQLADRVRVQVDATPAALVDVSAASVADLELRPGSRIWLSAKATETEAYADPASGRQHPERTSVRVAGGTSRP